MLKFTACHVWLKLDGDVAAIGITPYAAAQMGDMAGAELPKPGAHLRKGERAAVLESTLATRDLAAPLDGEVIEVNPDVIAEPRLINVDPQGRGWLYRLRLDDAAQAGALMSAQEYQRLLA